VSNFICEVCEIFYVIFAGVFEYDVTPQPDENQDRRNYLIENLKPGNIYQFRVKPEDPEKTIDLSQVTDKLYHIMLYPVLITLVVIGTDCTGSCKSNYHTTMTASLVQESMPCFL
jgi:hypothetical protein